MKVQGGELPPGSCPHRALAVGVAGGTGAGLDSSSQTVCLTWPATLGHIHVTVLLRCQVMSQSPVQVTHLHLGGAGGGGEWCTLQGCGHMAARTGRRQDKHRPRRKVQCGVGVSIPREETSCSHSQAVSSNARGAVSGVLPSWGQLRRAWGLSPQEGLRELGTEQVCASREGSGSWQAQKQLLRPFLRLDSLARPRSLLSAVPLLHDTQAAPSAFQDAPENHTSCHLGR